MATKKKSGAEKLRSLAFTTGENAFKIIYEHARSAYEAKTMFNLVRMEINRELKESEAEFLDMTR